jgi:uncharacterized protein (DUF362 family)
MIKEEGTGHPRDKERTMSKTTDHSMSRRAFISGGAAMISSLSAGLTPLPKSLAAAGDRRPAHSGRTFGTPRPAGAKSRVVLIKTSDRAEGVRRSLDLLNINPAKGHHVLIKPNFNTSDETPGSTHNDTLRAILDWAKTHGAKNLAIGDRSGPEPTEQVFRNKKIPELAGAFDARVINFDALGDEGYVKILPPGSHWKDGFLMAKPVVETDCVISTCCLKTHQFGGVFTMSLKNSVGTVPRQDQPYMRELHGSPHQREMIAEINYGYTPALVVLDGLVAFVDQGPMTGPRKTAEVFLAGTDRVAVDAVGLAILRDLGSNEAIMNTPIFAQEQIRRAAELGLGAASASAILIETDGKASESYAERIRKILYA